jgi:hypothetical protein
LLDALSSHHLVSCSLSLSFSLSHLSLFLVVSHSPPGKLKCPSYSTVLRILTLTPEYELIPMYLSRVQNMHIHEAGKEWKRGRWKISYPMFLKLFLYEFLQYSYICIIFSLMITQVLQYMQTIWIYFMPGCILISSVKCYRVK